MRRFGASNIATPMLKDYLKSVRIYAKYTSRFHIIANLMGYFDVGP